MGYRYTNLHLLHIVIAGFPAATGTSVSSRTIPNMLPPILINLRRLGSALTILGSALTKLGSTETAGNSWKLPETLQLICSKCRLVWRKPIFYTVVNLHFKCE